MCDSDERGAGFRYTAGTFWNWEWQRYTTRYRYRCESRVTANCVSTSWASPGVRAGPLPMSSQSDPTARSTKDKKPTQSLDNELPVLDKFGRSLPHPNVLIED